jgi:hypothetical protein
MHVSHRDHVKATNDDKEEEEPQTQTQLHEAGRTAREREKEKENKKERENYSVLQESPHSSTMLRGYPHDQFYHRLTPTDQQSSSYHSRPQEQSEQWLPPYDVSSDGMYYGYSLDSSHYSRALPVPSMSNTHNRNYNNHNTIQHSSHDNLCKQSIISHEVSDK